ncbi:hypothetical protein BKA56DRAFT_615580 [Ilyonectria sp. MPI-CAGE-AT-0026]|nr:hypothetical protein BKA56DRAFT_615580 [Ilyonectria sp. MPI-CAGE-AT-0026]
MVSDYRPSMPAFKEVKVDQITESRGLNIIAMLSILLQSGMSPIRFLRRIISLHTLRLGVLVSEAPPKPRPLSEADVPTLTQESVITKMLQRNGTYYDVESKAVCPRSMSRVLYSESVDDSQAIRAASGVHWKFARQGKADSVIWAKTHIYHADHISL